MRGAVRGKITGLLKTCQSLYHSIFNPSGAGGCVSVTIVVVQLGPRAVSRAQLHAAQWLMYRVGPEVLQLLLIDRGPTFNATYDTTTVNSSRDRHSAKYYKTENECDCRECKQP